MSERVIDDYIKSYRPAFNAWEKRADAENFAKYLAGELGVNPKGVTVDKDGKTYRVYIPLVSMYWAPGSNAHDEWVNELNAVTASVKQWAA